MSQPQELAKKVQLSWIGSRTRAFKRAVSEVRTLPQGPRLGLKKSIEQFLTIKQLIVNFRSHEYNGYCLF